MRILSVLLVFKNFSKCKRGGKVGNDCELCSAGVDSSQSISGSSSFKMLISFCTRRDFPWSSIVSGRVLFSPCLSHRLGVWFTANIKWVWIQKRYLNVPTKTKRNKTKSYIRKENFFKWAFRSQVSKLLLFWCRAELQLIMTTGIFMIENEGKGSMSRNWGKSELSDA